MFLCGVGPIHIVQASKVDVPCLSAGYLLHSELLFWMGLQFLAVAIFLLDLSVLLFCGQILLMRQIAIIANRVICFHFFCSPYFHT